jgi:hypothetical protein
LSAWGVSTTTAGSSIVLALNSGTMSPSSGSGNGPVPALPAEPAEPPLATAPPGLFPAMATLPLDPPTPGVPALFAAPPATLPLPLLLALAGVPDAAGSPHPIPVTAISTASTDALDARPPRISLANMPW